MGAVDPATIPIVPSNDGTEPTIDYHDNCKINLTVNGLSIPCSAQSAYLDSMLLVSAPSETSRRVYNPVKQQDEWAFWQAFGDGYAGYLPQSATYQGSGFWNWNRNSGSVLNRPGQSTYSNFVGGGYGRHGENDGEFGQQQKPPSKTEVTRRPVNVITLIEVGVVGTTNDLLDSVFDDKDLLKKINDCLKKLLKKNFSKFGEITKANAPQINPGYTSKQLEDTYTKKSTYAVWVPITGSGRRGVTFIGSEFFRDPDDWLIGFYQSLPGRSALQNAVVHELGNYASYIASGGKSYKLFGVSGATDDDSGYALQACVFNEKVQMTSKKVGK